MAERRIEGRFNQGWGFALAICALTALCFVGAYLVHQRTYQSPNDVLGPLGGAEERRAH